MPHVVAGRTREIGLRMTTPLSESISPIKFRPKAFPAGEDLDSENGPKFTHT